MAAKKTAPAAKQAKSAAKPDAKPAPKPAKTPAKSAAKPAAKPAKQAAKPEPKPAKQAAKQAAKPEPKPAKQAAKPEPKPAKQAAKSVARPEPKPAKTPAKQAAAKPEPKRSNQARQPAPKTAAKAAVTTTPARTEHAKTPPATVTHKTAPAKSTQSAKPAAQPAPAKPAPRAAGAPVHEVLPKPKFSKEGLGYTKDFDLHFIKAQFDLLQQERVHLTGQAMRLEDEAHQLVEEAEMGDVQFDDEGGEGDTMIVERERDLALSAQARDAVAEIDAALVRITEGTYGYSVVSGRPIPRERLEAIPWSSVLVEEKVGGIGRR
jgi:RNA polymerase-binding transcription factor DksA